MDINELGKNLKCSNSNCNSTLSLAQIINEKHLGLKSIFKIQCEICSIVTTVHTGKLHSNRNQKLSDTNTTAVLGKLYVKCVYNA